MKRFFDEVASQFDRLADSGHTTLQLGNDDLFNAQNIYRYRQQRGVNLGSWLVLERWITEEPFKGAHAPAQSDLDVAYGAQAKYILEYHWDTWIQEEDWRFIADHGINSVRIPIGYYHLCGADPTILHGTDFQPFYDVYRGAWDRITRAIQTAAAHGIGVLIDLHAAPGKQNNDAHGGTSGKANFFNDTHNKKCTIKVLESLVTNLHKFATSFDPPLPNIIGIELLNEPSPPSDNALQAWYKTAMTKIRAIDPTVPLYIGDCWRPEAYADFISHLPPSSALTVVDHHLYRCFTSSDITTSAQDLARALQDQSAPTRRMLTNTAEKAGRAGGGLVIGEWSGALNPGSLRGVPGEQKDWVEAQLSLYESVCAGWFFWTYKKQHPGDTGWSWRDSVQAGVFPKFVGTLLRGTSSYEEEKQKEARASTQKIALDQHVHYWAQYPGTYDHARFTEGYEKGWDDAFRFMLSTPPNSKTVAQLGFKTAWARARTRDHGKTYWEFETGFIQAVDAVTSWYTRL